MSSINKRIQATLMEFILLYKANPVLWNINHPLYKTKHARNKAWKLLLRKYREIEENAPMAVAKKKMENLRGSYKRERKKVLLANLKGGEYRPTIWYYKLFTFLDDLDQVTDDVAEKEFMQNQTTTASDQDSKNEGEDWIDEEALENVEVDMLEDESTDNQDSETNYGVKPTPTLEFKSLGKTKTEGQSSQIQNDEEYLSEEEGNDFEGTSGLQYTDVDTLKEFKYMKKAKSLNKSKKQLMQKYEIPLSEAKAFGMTVGLQLDALDPVQRTVAEKLISDVIFHARMKKLSDNSVLQP